MTFLWPQALWLLLALPALVAAYLLLLRRRRQAALRYASLSLLREALGPGAGLRRHLPPLLVLLALAVLLLAVARPAAVVRLPSQRQTIILAMDVSGSMRARDVEPNRLVASQEAAKAFLADLPAGVRVGVVSFAGTAAVVQAPTHSRADVVAAIDRFQLQRGTAIGSGIIVALATIFPAAGIDVGEAIYGSAAPRGPAPDAARQPQRKAPPPVPPGSYREAAVILLTDGQRTTGPDPLDAARMAADLGVRVYTVGVGTPDGEVIGFAGWSFRTRLDEDTLKAIANRTRGDYFHAGSAPDLRKVYRSLNARLVFERRQTEVTALFAAAGAAVLLLAAFLSILWFHRVL